MLSGFNEENTYTPREAAVLLGRSLNWVYVALRDGKLRNVGLGPRKGRIPAEDVKGLLREWEAKREAQNAKFPKK